MTIGVVIPTRNNRPAFLHQALHMLANQTMQPHHVEVVDYAAKHPTELDVAERYITGFKKCFEAGCDIVFCWEDDDYYTSIYIEVMVNKWILAGKPDLFGIGQTIYYHVFSQRYLEIHHPKKASMFCTMVTPAVFNLDLSSSNEYMDDFLWVKNIGKLNAKTYLVPRGQKPLAIGIKHGSTMVAGGAHEVNSQYYTKYDYDYQFLKSVTGPEFDFYSKSLFLKYSRNPIFKSETPFLSIITRCYKRPVGFTKNLESILELTDKDAEQIYITDKIGIGLYEANKSFGFVKNTIKGEYVFLLDDDDFITNPNMVSELKQIAKEHNPDVIFFRMTIKNGQNNNYYPTDELCWGNKPIIARIGGSCFVVKKEVYNKFIHHFAKTRCGDFYFINEVVNSGASVYWHDVKMCETGKVSRGKPE